MSVIIAGTFSSLHEGHKELINAAAKLGKHIIIGLTTDKFASKSKPYKLIPC